MYLPRWKRLCPQEMVDEGRFAHPGGADQHRRFPPEQIRAELLDSVTTQSTHRNNRDSGDDRGKLALIRQDLVKVSLRQQHDRRPATLVGHRQ